VTDVSITYIRHKRLINNDLDRSCVLKLCVVCDLVSDIVYMDVTPRSWRRRKKPPSEMIAPGAFLLPESEQVTWIDCAETVHGFYQELLSAGSSIMRVEDHLSLGIPGAAAELEDARQRLLAMCEEMDRLLRRL
jgi:hypothetical protein